MCWSSGRRWHDSDRAGDGRKQFGGDASHEIVQGLCDAWRVADVAALSLVELDDQSFSAHTDDHAPLTQSANTLIRDDVRADILAVPLDVVVKICLAKDQGFSKVGGEKEESIR